MIPPVKEQSRAWTASPAANPDGPQRETLDARDLQILGTVGRSSFAVTPDGRELRLKGPVRPERVAEAPADALLVGQVVRGDDGRPRRDAYLGAVVTAGTFAKLSKQKSYTPRARRVGPVDALLELRRPTARLPVHLAPDDDTPLGIVKGALSRRPLLLMTDGTPGPMTVNRIVELVNAEGGNLRHHNGRVLCDWTMVRRWHALLVAAWLLVEAHVAGHPLPCGYEHDGTAPVADTLDPVGVPTCNAHVGEAVE